jgi:hypothetical protein
MRISLQHIAAALLLIIGLVMPLACDAARLLDLAGSVAGAHIQLASDVHGSEHHCPECPVGHHCESDCCSNYAPLFQSPALAYSPTLGYLHSFSISTKPPQVYFSIFVPPQNHVA